MHPHTRCIVYSHYTINPVQVNIRQKIIIDNIPDISTDNAIVDYTLGAKRIYIDKNPDNLHFNENEKISTLPIRLTDWDGVERDDDEIVGKYSIFNKDYQDIEVTLFVKTGDGGGP